MNAHANGSPAPDDGDPVLDDLVDEFLDRLQGGEPIDHESFARAHPERAGRLRELLPALEAVAGCGPASADRDGAEGAGPDLVEAIGTLGDYRLIREVGRGGMGIVYEAEQLSLGRRVALKVLPFAASLDPRHRLRFQTEAHAAACLHHTHIVPVYTVGCDRGVYYYAMQFIEGRSLAALIRDLRRPGQAVAPGPAPHDDSTTWSAVRASATTSASAKCREQARMAARLGAQAAEALEHAHQQGILHRDVKPSNLLVDDRGALWVTDFGLARLQDDPGLTTTGDLLGTLRYMSPEQAQAKPAVVDHRSDVYSLGATLYELVTLRPAYDGRDRQELLRQIAQDEPVAPRRVDPAIPRDLETIVLKAMAKDPAGRYASMREMADDLGRFLDGQAIRARRPGPAERVARWARRHRALVSASAVILMLTCAGLAVGSALIWREKLRTEEAKHRAEVARARTEQNLALALQGLDKFCLYIAEKDFFQAPGRAQEVLKLQADALGLYERLVRQNPSDPQARWEAARAYHRVGKIRERLKQTAEAEAAYREALRLVVRLATEHPRQASYRQEWANVLLDLGKLEYTRAHAVEAEQSFRLARTIARALLNETPSDADGRLVLAKSYMALGTLEFTRNFPATGATFAPPPEAESNLREARTILEELAPRDPDRRDGRLELVMACSNLGQVYRFSRRPHEAEESFGRAIAELEEIGRRSPGDYQYRERVAELYSILCCPYICPPDRDPDKAARHFRRAVEAWDKLSRDFPTMARFREDAAHAHEYLAEILTRIGRPRESEPTRRRAAELWEALAADFPATPSYPESAANARLVLARTLLAVGRTAGAAAEARRAATSGSAGPDVKNNVAWFFATRPDFGADDYALAVRLAKAAAASRPTDRNFWNTLGAAHYRAGHWAEARSALEEGLRHADGDAWDWLLLALAHWRLGDRDQARRWHDRATAAMDGPNKPAADEDLRRFRAEADELIGRTPPSRDDRASADHPD
jgi:serine/threonine protein kinase